MRGRKGDYAPTLPGDPEPETRTCRTCARPIQRALPHGLWVTVDGPPVVMPHGPKACPPLSDRDGYMMHRPAD